MGKELAVELIDADGCTFNKNYRIRILSCIQAYQKIIKEYGEKSSFSAGEKALLKIFTDSAIQEQVMMIVKESELERLTTYALYEGKYAYKKQLKKDGFKGDKYKAEIETISDNELINFFIFQHIQYMEKVCPQLLRKIYILANQRLVERIVLHATKADMVVVMLGSNRQNYYCDRYNMREKGTSSIYKELKYFVEHVNKLLKVNKVKLDKFTLGDLHEEGEFKIGSNYEKIYRCSGGYVQNPFEKNKINIIYAIFHYIAKLYPEFQRRIHLYDDQPHILSGLRKFYVQEDNQLLPKGDRFEMQRYTGVFHSSTTIIGSGVIDYNFEKNTRLMAMMLGYDGNKENADLDMLENLDIKKFMQNRVTGWECIPYVDQAFFKQTKKFSGEEIQSTNITGNVL